MRILIAGGGTGGHLFPGVALAEEFKQRNRKNKILFVGTKKGIEKSLIPDIGYKLKTISGRGILGGGLMQKLRGSIQFLIGLFQSLMIIRTFKPDLVLGTGGYASAPIIIAASIFNIETAICEQNSIPGLTNRILGRLVKKVFIAFEECYPFFPPKKTFLTGNPVRREFLNMGSTLQKKKGDRFCLLVLGGSQGAHSINRAMIESLDKLNPIREKIKIIHQTGYKDSSWVKESYEKKNFQAKVFPFKKEIASLYLQADLVISRAGAITLTELLICGKPSILIPYPYAAYNHQEINARVLVNRGAARIILDQDLNGSYLGDTILNLFHQPEEIYEMANKAKTLARPEAAKKIVDHYCPDNST